MEGLYNIAISNHPHLPTISRSVDVIDLTLRSRVQKIDLLLQVNYSLDGKEIKELTQDIEVYLHEKEYPNPLGEGMITNYDAFVLMARNKGILEDMVKAGIAVIDEDGTITAKCKYKTTSEVVVTEPTETV